MKKIIAGLYLIILSVAIYNSLIAVLGFTVLDSDYSDTAMLWWGYQEHGWRFIKTWFYTQDNWLLSLLPWHALLFSIFSPTKTVVVLSGYFVFLLGVFLCGLIAWSLNAPRSAFWAPLLLLFSNRFAFSAGYIAYPISHNITLVFGLLMVLFAIQWLKHQKFWSLAMFFFTALIAGISDPWLIPCFCMPLIAAVLLLQQRQFYLLITFVAVLVVIMSNLFGVFYFLPRPVYSFANLGRFYSQLCYFIKNLGWYFNFFVVFNRVTAIGSLILTLILCSYIVKRLIKDAALNMERRLFFLTWAFSTGFLFLSFILYSHGVKRNTLEYSRYFMNIYFLTVLGIGIGAEIYWKDFSKFIKSQYSILAILFIITGLSSSLYLWKERPHIRRQEWFEDFLQVLQQNHLTYGYANYWQSSVITWLSQNSVLVRSIGFNERNGHIYHEKRVQTSPFWYQPQDIPQGQQLFFVYFEARDQICPSLELCRKGLIEQNGPPINTIPYKNGMIMVWSHPLFFEVNPYERYKKSYSDIRDI